MNIICAKNKFFFGVICAIVFLSFPFFGINADSKTDELKKFRLTLQKSNSNSEKVNALVDIAWYYLYMDTDSALIYAKRAYESSKSAGDFIESARIIGVTYSKQGDYEHSVKYNLEAFQYAQKIRNTTYYSSLLCNIGTNYLMLDDLDQSLKYFSMALEASQESKAKYDALLNLGQIFAIKNDFNKSYDYCQKALNVAEKANDTFHIACAYNRIGELFLDKKDYHKSLYYFGKSLKMLKDDDYYYKISCLRGNAYSYLGIGRYEMAIKTALQGDSLAKKGGYFNALSDINLLLSQINDSLRNPAQSMVYFKRYSAIKDSIFNIEKTKHINFLQTKFETKQHELEAKHFQREALFQKRMNYIYLVLSASILLTLFYFIKNIRQKNKILNFEKERLSQQKEKDKLAKQKLALELDEKHRTILTHAMQISQQKEVLMSVQSEIDNIIKLGEPQEIIHSVKQLSSDIKTRIDLSDDWDMIKLHFEKVHPEFFTRLKKDFPNLTMNDLKLCLYSKIKLTNKEAGRLLNINLSSVQVSRYRLKKKMNIPEEVNFDDFISGRN